MEPWSGGRVSFPLVVSGPSGVGKTSLVDRLLAADPRCRRSISCTTRTIREGEVDGESYTFLDEKTFLALRAKKGFAESARYNKFWYGTPKEPLDRALAAGLCVTLNIEVQGGLQIRDPYPDAVLVFVVPPTWEELERRLRERKTDSAEAIASRIARAREELREIVHYDYVIVNDSLDRCATDLIGIVRSERRRVFRLRGNLSTAS